jgi:hypothetical protein
MLPQLKGGKVRIMEERKCVRMAYNQLYSLQRDNEESYT